MSAVKLCLWYNKDAEEAARFYAATFPDSHVDAVHRAPADFPDGKAGDVLTVEFTLLGLTCIGLNGGPAFKHSEAFSFQIQTGDQAETDRLWNAIVGNGGQESACGWCKDRWGFSWQITPRRLLELTTSSDKDAAKRAFAAIDVTPCFSSTGCCDPDHRKGTGFEAKQVQRRADHRCAARAGGWRVGRRSLPQAWDVFSHLLCVEGKVRRHGRVRRQTAQGA